MSFLLSIVEITHRNINFNLLQCYCVCVHKCMVSFSFLSSSLLKIFTLLISRLFISFLLSRRKAFNF